MEQLLGVTVLGIRKSFTFPSSQTWTYDYLFRQRVLGAYVFSADELSQLGYRMFNRTEDPTGARAEPKQATDVVGQPPLAANEERQVNVLMGTEVICQVIIRGDATVAHH